MQKKDSEPRFGAIGRLRMGFISGLLAVSSAGLVAFPAVADTMAVPSFSFVTNHVEAGAEVVQTARMLISPEGELTKTGGGDWTIPFPLLPQPWSMAFTVKEGTLALGVTSPEAGAPPADLPDSVKAKALLWVDASDPVASHIAGENGQVSVWYDRREGADVSSPAYCRAESYTGYANETPSRVTLEDATDAVYFGGLGSGQAMRFLLPSGGVFNGYDSEKGVKHVFAVHAPIDTYGTLFGTITGNPTPFMRDASHSSNMANYYWDSATSWPSMANGRTYLNGERIDGTLTVVRKGLQLLEAERFYNVANVVSGFFISTAKTGSGGDYICEALVFTNSLTETERLLVTDYLMSKWLPDATGRTLSADVRSGAVLAVDSGDLDGSRGNIAFTGNGTVDVSGAEDFIVANDDSAVFDGTLSFSGLTATLRSPMAVALPGSGRVTAENTESGPETTVVPGSGHNIVKDGNDVLTVRSVPGTVRNVEVEEGTLSVLPACPSGARDEYVQIPVFDGGFEEYADEIDNLGEGKGVLPGAGVTLTAGGWDSIWNNGDGARVMNWSRWTGNDMDSATKKAWAFTSPPPEGDCALILRAGSGPDVGDAIARSGAFDLEPGLYELRFFLCGRQNATYLGQVFSPRLIAGTTPDLKSRFGDVMYTDLNGYKEFRLRTTVAESGSYRFEFRSIGNPGLGIVVVDDVRLYKVTPSVATASEWKIPGGDFETDSLPFGSHLRRFSVDNIHTNWTFVQSESWTEGCRADVGITTICATNTGAGHGTGVFFNDSRRPASGSVELCFGKSACSAVTTFKPPAGRWQLQGDLAQFGSYGVNPRISAAVTIGGVVYELGAIPAKTRLMQRFAWPASFSVDGTQEVTLVLTASGIVDSTSTASNGLLVDDLVLAGATGLDLMSGGDCEGWGDGHALNSDPSSVFGGRSGQCRSRKPSEAADAFGTRVIDGNYMITIENLSSLYEDVYIPFEGRYRLSFYVHSRLNNKSNYGPNPVRAWIAADGVTNVVGYADTYNSEWVQRVFDFNVPSAGVWRVALQGCDNPEVESHIHEAHVDAITLRQIPDMPDAPPPFPANCKVSVAEGARLEVDFAGTNVVRGLRLGGVWRKGVVDVADHPGYLSGRGTFKVVPYGTCFTVR